MMTFSAGLPDMDSMLLVEGYGYATFVRHHENGTVDIRLSSGRVMTIPGETQWCYTRQHKMH